MVPAPEMAAFAERFGFLFRAHEKGDANRSARVERPFFHRTQFLGRSHFPPRRSQYPGADVLRQGERHPEAPSPRQSAGAVCRRAVTPAAVAAFVPEVYRAPSSARRCRGVCQCARPPLFGPGGVDRPPGGGARDQGQIQIQFDARRIVAHRRSSAEAVHPRVMLAEHRPPRGHRARVPIRIPKSRRSPQPTPDCPPMPRA